MINPLLENFNTPFHSAPFSKINNEHYLPAIKEAIEEAKKEINAIIEKEPTFLNTIVGLDLAGKKLNTISSLFFNLNTAETNDEMQALAKDISPLLSEYGNDIILNADLLKKVEEVYLQLKNEDLPDEDRTLLDKTYKSFVRNGAGLSEEKKAELRKIDIELSTVTLQFSENVLADTNDYILWVEDLKDLKGLPDYAVEAAKETAVQVGKPDQWGFSLHMPSYLPFMTYADSRELRKKLFLAKGEIANQDNDHNNRENVLKIVSLRQRRAKLLGYKDHAAFTLEERMAKDPKTVTDFLNDLLEKALPAGRRDYDLVQSFANGLDGIKSLERWDFAYYSEKLKMEKFAIDDNLLKPYFPLDKVEKGAFDIAEKLYGITFHHRKDIEVYHPDVKAFDVHDEDGKHLAVFYTDYFPRKGKKNGAWMTSYQSAYFDTEEHRPHISIVCNFSKPTKSKPSLLTFQEVTTLFHEFGHALHGILGRGKYSSLTGTSVYWDFVELPSQIMENWCYQKEALHLFAKHYETGETIPDEWIDKIVESANFLEGYSTLRQLSFGLLDMAWYGRELPENAQVETIEREAMEKTDLFPPIENYLMSTSFNHIFPGGYSSGYYSYKWAEVLDADAFEAFSENGLFDPQTAKKFKVLLESGGSVHPMTLFENFRGRKPKVDALLKRAGLA